MVADRAPRPGGIPGWAHVAVMVALVAVIVAAVAAAPPTPADRTGRLAAQLRCPVCQGVSVAESRSDTALAMQDQIRRMVESGESDAEIREYFVDRYGQWVLLDPSGDGLGLALWVLPAAALAAGVAVVMARRRRPGPSVGEDAATGRDASGAEGADGAGTGPDELP